MTDDPRHGTPQDPRQDAGDDRPDGGHGPDGAPPPGADPRDVAPPPEAPYPDGGDAPDDRSEEMVDEDPWGLPAAPPDAGRPRPFRRWGEPRGRDLPLAPAPPPPPPPAPRVFDDATVARHADMLANRLRKRFAHLSKRFARQDVDCFRLYDRDIPEVRAVVDWYAGHVVIAEYVRLQTGPGYLPALAAAAGQALGVPADRVHPRQRRTGGGSEEDPRYRPLADTGNRFAVHERDLRFWVNLTDRLDTGLFPDHRDTRAMVRELAERRDFLNLYAYTGAFTCAAAAGGARSTTTVDRASTYVDWARDNLELNRLWGPQHRMVRADTEDFLARARGEGRLWDLLFVDPPSFSNRKGVAVGFDVNRDHPDLLRRVLDVTAPGGLVFFSTNHQRFEPRLEGLAAASVEEITGQTVPEDYRNRQVHRCWRIRARGG